MLLINDSMNLDKFSKSKSATSKAQSKKNNDKQDRKAARQAMIKGDKDAGRGHMGRTRHIGRGHIG